MAVYPIQAAPIRHRRHLVTPKLPPEKFSQLDLPRVVRSHKMHELVPVVEHDKLVDVARPEDAIIEDQPLRSSTHNHS